MKKASNISRLASETGQRNIIPLRSGFVLTWSFLVLGALTVWFYQLSATFGGFFFRLLAHLSGMLATIVFLLGIALFAALQVRSDKESQNDRVLAALRATLKGPHRDPDARVRAEAAKGLGQLDLEESILHEQHEDLDALLISTLDGNGQDPAPNVRFEAAKGLAKVELEQHSYHHKHRDLDDYIFEHNPLQ